MFRQDGVGLGKGQDHFAQHLALRHGQAEKGFENFEAFVLLIADAVVPAATLFLQTREWVLPAKDVVTQATLTLPAKAGARQVCVRAVDVFGFEAEVNATVELP